MRPVTAEFPINQPFGSMKTQSVAANPDPASGAGYYVHLYGNYQPYGHAGADFKCPEGTPVHAIAAGTVLWADWGTKLPGDDSNAGYRKRWYLYKGFPGIVTVIQHAGWIGVYAHLSVAPLNVGDTVTEGQVIGLSGGTGGVAPHLHVEALVDLTYKTFGGLIYGRTDPEPYFGGLAAMGSTTQASEEIDVAAEENIMARLAQIVEWQDARFREVRDNDERNRNMLAGFMRDVVNAKETLTPEQLDVKFTELTAAQEQSGPRLYKSDEDEAVYVYDAGAGFRHIGKDEYLALITTGAHLSPIDQDIITKAAGGSK